MKRLVLAASVAGGLFLLGATEVSGHGGQYRGPGDTVPPAEGPGPGTGGPNTGGPTTPGPGSPTPPGGRGPTTPPGGPTVPGGTTGPRGPVTPGPGGKKNRPAEGFEQWQFWWEANKDPYLNLKASLGAKAQRTGSAGFLFGLGRKEETVRSNRPSTSEIHELIVPTLKGVMGETDADILDSAVLALARVTDKDDAGLVFETIKTGLASEHATVKQSSILALGVLGSTEAVPLLKEIMNDTPEGRRLVGERNTIQNLQRAFAALSLGFIGAEESVDLLIDVLKKEQDTERDLKCQAITALGLFEQPSAREKIVPFLAELLDDDKLDQGIRAQVPVALGRLGESAIPTILNLQRLVKSQKVDSGVQQSCIIALGQLCNASSDPEVVPLLQDVIKEGKDVQSRHFAFIALAQIGIRAAKQPEAEGHAAVLAEINKFFLKQLSDPDPPTHQPWAAVALGLLGREYSQSSQDWLLLATKIQETLEKSNNPSYTSAMAVALGLMKATSSGKMLFAKMADTNDLDLKGYLALALGMMRYSEGDTLKTLRGMVEDNRDANLRLQVATALGLLGDTEAVPKLIDGLRTATTLNVYSSIARALGLIGDKSALQPLQDLINDKRAPGLARAFGCVAMGLIGEKFEYYWNTRVSVNANYRIVIPSQYEVTDIL